MNKMVGKKGDCNPFNCLIGRCLVETNSVVIIGIAVSGCIAQILVLNIALWQSMLEGG